VRQESGRRRSTAEKLLVYRGVSSLVLYLIMAQNRREVTVHFRDAAGIWQAGQAKGADTIFRSAVWANTSVILNAGCQGMIST